MAGAPRAAPPPDARQAAPHDPFRTTDRCARRAPQPAADVERGVRGPRDDPRPRSRGDLVLRDRRCGSDGEPRRERRAGPHDDVPRRATGGDHGGGRIRRARDRPARQRARRVVCSARGGPRRPDADRLRTDGARAAHALRAAVGHARLRQCAGHPDLRGPGSAPAARRRDRRDPVRGDACDRAAAAADHEGGPGSARRDRRRDRDRDHLEAERPGRRRRGADRRRPAGDDRARGAARSGDPADHPAHGHQRRARRPDGIAAHGQARRRGHGDPVAQGPRVVGARRCQHLRRLLRRNGRLRHDRPDPC